MSFGEQLILIVGLAMDGFAVSVCMGLCLAAKSRGRAALVAGSVTGFHVLFFILGHLSGSLCAGVIRRAAPYIAGGILLLLGLSMLRDALRGQSKEPDAEPGPGRILTLSLASSIDAMTVGFGFAILGAPLWTPSALVAAVMGALSCGGVLLGRFLGSKFCRRAKLFGALVLCVFGLKNILFGG